MSLETTNALLDAVLAPAASQPTARPVPDAATDEIIGYAPQHSVDDLNAAVEAARSAQPGWASLGHQERSRLLRLAADEVDAHAGELANIISREQGKPLNGAGSRFEAAGCAVWLRSAADAVVEPEVVFEGPEGQRSEIYYDPLGVVGAISPWNWPALIAIWQIAPSLRMGNTVVAKPSEYTPLSVLAVVELMNRHLPQDVLTAVSSGDREVGAALAAHPDVDKVMFTGSTATGRKIIESSAHNLARLTLELGGNDPGIILPGTDIEPLAEGLFWGAFINTGQTCAAMKRLYVHESQYEEAVQALATVASSLPMGAGVEESTALGPLSTDGQFRIVSDLVDDARQRGARIVTGGSPEPALGPRFFQATIVADIDDDAPLVTEEQFGPVLPVVPYRTVDEAVDMANRLDAGLGASVWGEREEALEVAGRIRSGTVWINQHGTLNPEVPFGGTKASGYGLEFGLHGLKAVASPKVVTV
ncbi:aldehyde dehydrogenase family protein [Citricoccus sp. GCM10030269]|uniref:aldehyde dehydrogenase family protein n=1 Tax=Citricoccus sp. GCM10030269 TaxID=3273388 RepID=UPI00361F5B84